MRPRQPRARPRPRPGSWAGRGGQGARRRHSMPGIMSARRATQPPHARSRRVCTPSRARHTFVGPANGGLRQPSEHPAGRTGTERTLFYWGRRRSQEPGPAAHSRGGGCVWTRRGPGRPAGWPALARQPGLARASRPRHGTSRARSGAGTTSWTTASSGAHSCQHGALRPPVSRARPSRPFHPPAACLSHPPSALQHARCVGDRVRACWVTVCGRRSAAEGGPGASSHKREDVTAKYLQRPCGSPARPADWLLRPWPHWRLVRVLCLTCAGSDACVVPRACVVPDLSWQ